MLRCRAGCQEVKILNLKFEIEDNRDEKRDCDFRVCCFFLFSLEKKVEYIA